MFPFDFIFNKIIHPRRLTITECNKLVRHKVGKNVYYSFIKDSNLPITVLLFNRNSQITDLMECSILLMCVFL